MKKEISLKKADSFISPDYFAENWKFPKEPGKILDQVYSETFYSFSKNF